MHLQIETLLSSILQGGVLALLAVSLSLVFGVMRIVNFAQADFMALGMYGVVVAVSLVHVPSVVLGFAMFIPGLIVGVVVYRGLLAGQASAGSLGGFQHSQLLLTYALALIIEAGAQIVFSGTPRTVGGSVKLATWSLAGFTMDLPRTIAFVVAIVLSLALLAFLRSTQTGRRIRATAADDRAAQIVGINVVQVRTLVFGTSIGLAAVAGGILVAYYPVTPTTGGNFIFMMFAAVALGGLGNIVGSLVGGLIIGLAQGLGEIFMPLQLVDVVIFGIFLAVIFVRPTGIFGSTTRL